MRVVDTFVCLFSLNESSTKGVSVDKMELVLQLKLMENHELCNKFTEFCLSGGRHHDDDDDTNHMNALRTPHTQTLFQFQWENGANIAYFMKLIKSVLRSCKGSKETILFYILEVYFVVHVTFCIHMRLQ